MGEAGTDQELCEECGSPLVDGFCSNCGSGFSGGASPVGAAPLDRSELSKVLGRPVGPRAHGSYSLSMQQEKRMAPLRKEIESLVERFNASSEVKAAVKQNAEKMAVKIMDELGPTAAAIVSVAQEFIGQGRNLAEVSSCIARVHTGMDRVKDLTVEVCPAPAGEIRVLVEGRERPFRAYSSGPYVRLRMPLFISDAGGLVELRNARLTETGYDDKKIKPLGPSEFVIKGDDRNFELFKLIKEARLSGDLAGVVGGADLKAAFRKYSISKLPVTERLLRETGLLQAVSTEYARRLTQSLADGGGISPKKLAEKALEKACERVVPSCVGDSVVQKYHLKPSAMKSLIVRGEFEAWQG